MCRLGDDVLERELVRFGKIASPFRAISLGCKNPSLKHVMSFRRQVYMFLESPDRTLNVSFRIKYEGGIIYDLCNYRKFALF